MTVKEVFELRREGKVEEAYQAILPMYHVHHGKYTTLAMFWCAIDMLNLLLSRVEGKDEISAKALNEAEKIYMSLLRLYPQIHDETGSGKQKLANMGEALKTTREKMKG